MTTPPVAGPSSGPVRWNQAIIARMSWVGSGTCTLGKVTSFSPAWLISRMKLACQVAVEWPSNRLIEPFLISDYLMGGSDAPISRADSGRVVRYPEMAAGILSTRAAMAIPVS